MKKIKYISVGVLMLIISATTLMAKRYEVATAEEITALKVLRAGDTVVMKSGEWVDQTVVMRGEGMESKPVVLMAEQAGKTLLKGSSNLSISGNYIIVSGLNFEDNIPARGAVVDFRTGSTRFANYSKLVDCKISGRNLPDSEVDYKWVSLYGIGNEVSGCSFIDKANMGTLLVVWLEDGLAANHTIKGNYFNRPRMHLDDKGKAKNGQETLRIGTSQVSMTAAKCVVEGNYFFECNGEVECVSNKSCENIYRGNVFENCNGTLTLRHGRSCEVYGNAFYGGNGKTSGGVRLIDEGHKVYNNYFQDLTGSGYSSAISLLKGEVDSKLSGYFAASNCYVVNNTIANCSWGLNVNYGSTRQTIDVQGNVIAYNVIVAYGGVKSTGVIISGTSNRLTMANYKRNVVFGVGLREATLFDFAGVEFDPELRPSRGFYVPFRRTALEEQTVERYDFVTTDFFGEERDEKKSVLGAFNIQKRVDSSKVPTAAGSGVSWK